MPTPPADPRVVTASGPIRGRWEETTGASPARVAVFRGIPYAEAPVGALRFAAPVPRAPWREELNAADFGPTPQRGDAGITLIPEHSVAGEDTLSVNVWSPEPAKSAKLPVLVWIHGGGYISGSPVSPWYDGGTFARDGVVLVTISYRLGFTGFGALAGPEPTAEAGTGAGARTPPAPGEIAGTNRGVLDWICALEWVQRHIVPFGGDPDRVTIAGQSAGGGAVLTLMGCPGAQGLFHGAYAMSPAIADPSLAAAFKRTERLARASRVTPDAAGIASLDEARILELQRGVISPTAPRLLRETHGLLRAGLMMGPVVDGVTVPTGVTAAVASGPNARVPLVIGTAADELAGLFRPRGVLDRTPRRPLLRALGATARETARWLEDPTSGAREGAMRMLGRYATDAVFRRWVPTVAQARTGSQAAGPTWTYSFDWHAEAPAYAGHCSDIPFAFDLLAADGVAKVAGDAPPQQLANQVHGALVAFVRDGDPGWAKRTASASPTRSFSIPQPNDDGTVAHAYRRAGLLVG